MCKEHEEEGEKDLKAQFEDNPIQVISGPEFLVWEVMES